LDKVEALGAKREGKFRRIGNCGKGSLNKMDSLRKKGKKKSSSRGKKAHFGFLGEKESHRWANIKKHEPGDNKKKSSNDIRRDDSTGQWGRRGKQPDLSEFRGGDGTAITRNFRQEPAGGGERHEKKLSGRTAKRKKITRDEKGESATSRR